MISEIEFLKGEVRTIKNRIAKAERRLAAGKVTLGESEETRKNCLLHVLGKKEERIQLLISGKEC